MLGESITKDELSEQTKFNCGDRVQYLTITSNVFIKEGRKCYKAVCGCGTETEVLESNLISGTRSCGCIKGEITEPLTKLPSRLKSLRKNA